MSATISFLARKPEEARRLGPSDVDQEGDGVDRARRILHDIRGSLGAISLMIDPAHDDTCLGAHVIEALEQIAEGSRRAADLCRASMSVARVRREQPVARNDA